MRLSPSFRSLFSRSTSFLRPILGICILCFLGCEAYETERLIKDLAHAESPVRRKAAYRLVDQGSSAVEPLIKAIESGSDTLRYIGAQVLGRIGASRARTTLLALARDPNIHVSKEAVLSLSKIGIPSLLDTVRHFLQSTYPTEIRAAAAESMASFRDTSACPPLWDALSDTSALVRQSALASLNKIWIERSTDYVYPLMNDPDETVRYISTQIAAIRGTDTVLPQLRNALYDSNTWVRREAVRGIVSLGDTASAEDLLFILQHYEGEDADAAREALIELTGIEYVVE